jgi:hypothetical protein
MSESSASARIAAVWSPEARPLPFAGVLVKKSPAPTIRWRESSAARFNFTIPR